MVVSYNLLYYLLLFSFIIFFKRAYLLFLGPLARSIGEFGLDVQYSERKFLRVDAIFNFNLKELYFHF